MPGCCLLGVSFSNVGVFVLLLTLTKKVMVNLNFISFQKF